MYKGKIKSALEFANQDDSSGKLHSLSIIKLNLTVILRILWLLTTFV